MSILDMKHHQSSSADVATDQQFDALVAQVDAPIVSTHVASSPPNEAGSRVARFFAALRHSSVLSAGGPEFADPRIYDEYLAGLARRDREQETILQK